jgi:hypothetical protein
MYMMIQKRSITKMDNKSIREMLNQARMKEIHAADDVTAELLGYEPLSGGLLGLDDLDLSGMPPMENDKDKLVKELVAQLQGNVGRDENGSFIENDKGKFYIDLKLTSKLGEVQADYVERPKQTHYSWCIHYQQKRLGPFVKAESNVFFFDIEQAAKALGNKFKEIRADKGADLKPRIKQTNPDGSWVIYNYEWNDEKLLRTSVHDKFLPNYGYTPPKPMSPKTKQLIAAFAVMVIGLLSLSILVYGASNPSPPVVIESK